MQNNRQTQSDTINSHTFNIPDVVQRLQCLVRRFPGVCWRFVSLLGVYNCKYRRVFRAVGVGGFGVDLALSLRAWWSLEGETTKGRLKRKRTRIYSPIHRPCLFPVFGVSSVVLCLRCLYCVVRWLQCLKTPNLYVGERFLRTEFGHSLRQLTNSSPHASKGFERPLRRSRAPVRHPLRLHPPVE